MVCKVYAHLDVQGHPALTLPVEIPKPEETQFGVVKQALLRHYAARGGAGCELPDENACCFWNQDCCPIADRAPVAVHAWEHNDFFLRPLPEGSDGAAAGALAASRKERGDLSYYYAHNRGHSSLVGGVRAPSSAAAAAVLPAAAPRQPLVAGPAAGRYNFKQSPFGTDIAGYETITTYTWEDHDDNTVKVLLPLDGIGKLPPSAVRSQFGERCFEVLIEGYNGKNLRFATHKTHGEMNPDECKHMIRANRITMVIRKAKEKDIWFDLFKKRAIGDDDDP